MQTNIKIIIFSDYLLLSDGIERIIEKEQNMTLVGKIKKIPNNIETLKNLMPDVILVDLATHKTGCIKLSKYIKDNNLSTKILLLAEGNGEDTIMKSFLMGVHGCLPKGASSNEMIKAIRTLNNDEIWMRRKLMSKFISQYSRPENNYKKLTNRETDIAQSIVQGFSNKEIANGLCISEKTVKSHITRIFTKMEVDSRVKLTIKLLPNNH
jgi:DNA-binding NarL/FixJ family response regulator